jgi:hypothetical protein
MSSIGQTDRLYHKIFSKTEGLDFDNTKAMAFDDEGFLWLGGINYDVRDILLNDKKSTIQRFDGKTFHSFELPEREEKARSVFQIYKRKDGKFYILGGKRTIELFNPLTQEFTLISSSKYCSPIFEYNGANYLLTQIGREISLVVLNNDLTFTPLFSFTSSENRFLVGLDTQIVFNEIGVLVSDDNFPPMFFDWRGELLKRFSSRKYISEKTGKKTKYYLDEVFYQDDEIYTFIFNNQQLHKIDFETQTILPVKRPNSLLLETSIYSYKDVLGNNRVLHTSGQDLMFNSYGDEGFSTVVARGVFDRPLSMRCISKDLTKDIWVANGDGELHYFKFPSNNISTFLSNHQLRTIVPFKENRYLVATEDDGWFAFNEESKEINRFNISEKGKEIKPNSSRNIIIENDIIWTQGAGIAKINALTKEWGFSRHYPVLCFEELNDSTFVYGTKGYHLMKFNKRTMTHDFIIKTDTLIIYDIAIHDSLLMGATNKGVLRYDFKSKISHLENNKNLIGDSHLLMADYKEPYGYIFGSRDGTISVYDAEIQEYKTIYKDELNAGIAKIVYDDSIWWISTFNGLVAYHVKDKSVKRYSVKDGLSHNEGNRYSGLKTKEGILISSVKGLNYFRPEELSPERISSQLQLLKVKNYDVDKEEITSNYNRKTIGEMANIILSAEHKELEIDFSLTNNVSQNENS